MRYTVEKDDQYYEVHDAGMYVVNFELTKQQANVIADVLNEVGPYRREGWYALRQDWPSGRDISAYRFIGGKWLSAFDDVFSAAEAEDLEKNGVWIGDIADEHR